MAGPQKTSTEVRVELTVATLLRIEAFARLSERSIPDETVSMMRFALRMMYPPSSPEEWRKVVEWEDWADLLRWTLRFVRYMFRRLLGRPERAFVSRYEGEDLAKYHRVALRVPEKLMSKIQEIARFKLIPISEAAEYTIEYALREVFPECTPEERDRELRELWQKIWHAVWGRS